MFKHFEVFLGLPSWPDHVAIVQHHFDVVKYVHSAYLTFISNSFLMQKDNLNLRQRKFVNAYIANGGIASKAYEEAGYESATVQTTDTAACQLLRNPKVEIAINEELVLLAKASRITFDRKLGWLGDIAEDGMQLAMPADQKKTIVPASMIDSRSSISAISELNRMQGHHAATNSNINIQQVSFSQSIGNPADLGSNDERPVQGETIDQ